jgi:hypothetical protein
MVPEIVIGDHVSCQQVKYHAQIPVVIFHICILQKYLNLLFGVFLLLIYVQSSHSVLHYGIYYFCYYFYCFLVIWNVYIKCLTLTQVQMTIATILTNKPVKSLLFDQYSAKPRNPN